MEALETKENIAIFSEAVTFAVEIYGVTSTTF